MVAVVSRECLVDGVAQDDLDMGDEFKRRRRHLGAPLVEAQRCLGITLRLLRYVANLGGERARPTSSAV